MNLSTQHTALGDKLMGPLSSIIERHGGDILPLLAGKSGELSHAALKNDETVRTVATYCYALLPGLVRLAVKEPAFISFVMSNREQILTKLVAKQEKAEG
jgi:hypothetical protein